MFANTQHSTRPTGHSQCTECQLPSGFPLPSQQRLTSLTTGGLLGQLQPALLTIQAMTSRKLSMDVGEGERLIWSQIPQSLKVLGLGFKGNWEQIYYRALYLKMWPADCLHQNYLGVLIKDSGFWVSFQTTESEVPHKVSTALFQGSDWGRCHCVRNLSSPVPTIGRPFLFKGRKEF